MLLWTIFVSFILMYYTIHFTKRKDVVFVQPSDLLNQKWIVFWYTFGHVNPVLIKNSKKVCERCIGEFLSHSSWMSDKFFICLYTKNIWHRRLDWTRNLYSRTIKKLWVRWWLRLEQSNIKFYFINSLKNSSLTKNTSCSL